MAREFTRRVLLTGANGGIGKALTRELARFGHRLLLVGRNEEQLRCCVNSLPALQRLGFLALDLCEQNNLAAVARRAEQDQIDTLINLHGTNEFCLFRDQGATGIDDLIDTNLRSPMLLTQAVLPILERAESGLVVNVGSTFGSLGHAGYASYCATKFGLRGFSEALSREYADSRLDVVYVAPRATRTSMSERAGRSLNDALGVKEDSAEHVATLIANAMHARKKRSFFGWPERFFARLNQLFPSVVDRALAGRLALIKEHAIPNRRRT